MRYIEDPASSLDDPLPHYGHRKNVQEQGGAFPVIVFTLFDDPVRVELSAVPPCSYGSLVAHRVYLLDTAQLILLLFGGSVPLRFLSKLTSVAPPSRETQPLRRLRVEPARQNEPSQGICAVVGNIRERRKGYQPITLLLLDTEQEQHLCPC